MSLPEKVIKLQIQIQAEWCFDDASIKACANLLMVQGNLDCDYGDLGDAVSDKMYI